MRNTYIYEHINPHTNKVFYVGVGYSDNDRVNDVHDRNQAWYNEVEKIGGFDKVKTNIIVQGNFSISEIRSWEYYIAQYYYSKGENYCSFEHRVHGKDNPNYGNRWTDEQKKALSIKQTGKYKGKKNPNYGKKWSKEEREAASRLMHERYRNGFINGRAKPVTLYLTNGEIVEFVQKKDMFNFIKEQYGVHLPSGTPPGKPYIPQRKKFKPLTGIYYIED